MDTAKAVSMLRLAHADFRAMGAMLDIEAFDEVIFGFHAQQAIEKALKAWLHGLGQDVLRTHDLTELLKALRRTGIDVAPYLPLAEFTLFAVQARYEEGIVTPADPLDRPTIVAEVGALLEYVEKQVGAQA
ncbi:MAG: HEPN domain-containing protein [Sulfurisoma sp.]|nr:HEPN domain-containing protein [Sulfurisoma sp.]